MYNLEDTTLRVPTLKDGMALYRLVAHCPPLDRNSSYCNLLQCSHFADTSVAADRDGTLVGFISGYLIPGCLDRLFVWQVAVTESMRGLGLASCMLDHILNRSICKTVRYIETSIVEKNQASWALFKRLAQHLSADWHTATWMDNQIHFAGEHATEILVRIGPFLSSHLKKQE